LIVFDLDGTLVDSRRDLADATNAMLSELGARPLPEAEVIAMVGEGAQVLVERALAATGRPAAEVPRALDRFLAIYETHLLDHTRPYHGVPELLAHLAGVARLAVLTNKPTHASTRLLEGLGLSQYFEEIVGGDGGYPRKPDPAALLRLMETSRTTRRRTILVGDSAVDLETARNAGVPCCLVRYGFGFREARLEQSEAFIAGSPQEVAEFCLTSFRTEQ
jgi:phosphoglycolate phosphatase